MKLAFLYTDKRGKYIASHLAKYADVVDIDLSDIKIGPFIRTISTTLSFHINRSYWLNDYYRNPFIIDYLRKVYYQHIVSKGIGDVDAVLKFGVMVPCDYDIFKKSKLFLYADGIYDPDSIFWSAPRFGAFFSSLQKKIYESATVSFTFSDWARAQLHSRYAINLEKIVRCGWGPCLPVPSVKISKNVNPRKLIFVGNEIKRKGLDLLMDAYKRVRSKYYDVTLDVVGVNNFGGYRNDKGVKFYGQCDKGTVIDLLNQCHVLILPSRYDRSPHVIVEAMFYGVPVIVANTCGAPEPVVAGDCGIVVSVGSVNELENAIIEILSKPELYSRMSANAVNEAFAHWSWDKICKEMVNVIQKSLGD